VQFSLAQLEPGPAATPFEHRPMATELAMCQRYYYKIGRGVFNYVLWATGGGNNAACVVNFPVSMRVPPTFPDSGSIAFVSPYGASSPYGTVTSLRDFQGTSTDSTGVRVNWTGSAPFQAYMDNLQADAEL